MLSLDSVRHAAQTAFIESGSGLVFGTSGWISLPDDLHAAVQENDHDALLGSGALRTSSSNSTLGALRSRFHSQYAIAKEYQL